MNSLFTGHKGRDGRRTLRKGTCNEEQYLQLVLATFQNPPLKAVSCSQTLTLWLCKLMTVR